MPLDSSPRPPDISGSVSETISREISENLPENISGDLRGDVSWADTAYFASSIAILGSFLGCALAAPLLALGRAWPAAGRRGDRVMVRGIRLLLDLQPWLTVRAADVPARRERERGVLLVANHRSHLDAFLFHAYVPGVRIVAKRLLFRLPFLGPMMYLCRQIPSDRGDLASFQKVFETVRQRLLAREVVQVFPEMTRCPPGFRGTRAFALAPFQAAIRAGALVIPVAISGTDHAWPRGGRGLRRRVSGRPHAIGWEMLEPLEPASFASPAALRDAARNRINSRLSEVLS